MTTEELQNLANVSYNGIESGLFWKTVAADGYMLTEWVSDMSISEYSGTKVYCMPIRDEYPNLRTITEEEHEALEAEKRAYEEEHKDDKPSESKSNEKTNTRTPRAHSKIK